MSFWDTYDARQVDVHPGYVSTAVGKVTKAASPFEPGAVSEARCSQNDTTGVCDFCGIASEDVLLGVCADCV